MTKWWVIAFFMAVITFQIQGNYRDLLILVDWYNEKVKHNVDFFSAMMGPENGLGPITNDLLNGLTQKTFPILVSSATWRNFVERREIFSDFILLDEATLQEKYKNSFAKPVAAEDVKKFKKMCIESITPGLDYTKKLNKTDLIAAYQITDFLLPYIIKVDQSEWSMTKITEHWYLLVPKNYLEKIKKEKFPSSFDYFPKNISKDEWVLGLKFGQPLLGLFDKKKHSNDLNVQYQNEFLEAVKRLFITFDDIKYFILEKNLANENISKYLCCWYFYLSGHGGPSVLQFTGKIAGLDVIKFRNLLTFFNNTIKTDFLFYDTCYAGGEHLNTSYIWNQPSLKPEQRTKDVIKSEEFNYIIGAATLAYRITSSLMSLVLLPFDINENQPGFRQDFSKFFEEIKNYVHPELKGKKIKENNLAHIINLVTGFLTETGEMRQKMQIPVFRYPNTEWFSVIDEPKNIFRLTNVVVETHEAENREIVVKDKAALILYVKPPVAEQKSNLYHNETLGTVVIKKEKSTASPTVLFYAPGNAVYYFEIIKADQSEFLELIKSFIPPLDEEYSRRYYINRLVCYSNLRSEEQRNILGRKMIVESFDLENVIFLHHGKNPIDPTDKRTLNGMIFTYKSNNFHSFWESNDAKSIAALQQLEFPNLTKIESKDFIVPVYPFPLPEKSLTKLVDVLKGYEKEKTKRETITKQEKEALERTLPAPIIVPTLPDKPIKSPGLGQLNKLLIELQNRLTNLKMILH